MVDIHCALSAYNAGAKGGKIALHLDMENAKHWEAVLANFRDKPLLVSINVDARERQAQLSRITDEQRRMAYSLINAVADHSGDDEDSAKQFLKATYCADRELPLFSLSDCDKEVGTDFIDWLAEFCLEHNVPTEDHANNYVSDIAAYQIACIKYRKCCVCGKYGEVHHYDAIGAGRDRRQYDDSDHRKLCLCRTHHAEAHQMGRETFCERYHLDPVVYNG